VTRVTAVARTVPEHAAVPNIVLEDGLRARVEELLSRRRDVWRIVLALCAIVVVALFLWGRGATARIAPPAPVPGALPSTAVAPSATPALFVDVAGEVRAPGLYSLPLGARVADALAAAGGPTRRADLESLNLAEVLADGTKIEVPGRGAGQGSVTEGTGAAPPAPSGPPLVPLNSADQAALETIPGIGPVTAMAILAYRERAGPFSSVDQLLEVDGIGPATLEQIRPYLHV
jgi:competence protein ComEA